MERDSSPEPGLRIQPLCDFSSLPLVLKWYGPELRPGWYNPRGDCRGEALIHQDRSGSYSSAAGGSAGAQRVAEACDLIGPGLRWAGPDVGAWPRVLTSSRGAACSSRQASTGRPKSTELMGTRTSPMESLREKRSKSYTAMTSTLPPSST